MTGQQVRTFSCVHFKEAFWGCEQGAIVIPDFSSSHGVNKDSIHLKRWTLRVCRMHKRVGWLKVWLGYAQKLQF